MRRITSVQAQEASWLHTLSYLEHVAARKISRTIASTHPSAEVLDHLADDTRHAAEFSRLAASLLGSAPSDYLCRETAGVYFYKLDRELSAWAEHLVGEPHDTLNYLLVTSMVCQRAVMLYELYRSTTREAAVRHELASIISEERRRCAWTEQECVRLLAEWDINDLAAPRAVESAFFAEFWSAVEQELDSAEPLAAA